MQLHLHTEWLEFAPDSPVGGRTGQHIKDFTREDQAVLIEYGIARLVAAGAPRPTAFRAGNYGANDDTLRALALCGRVVGVCGKPRVQRRELRIACTRFGRGDLEVPARGAHARIEGERAQERVDRIRQHSLAEVQDAEVVECTRIVLLDAVGQRTQQLHVAARRNAHRHLPSPSRELRPIAGRAA